MAMTVTIVLSVNEGNIQKSKHITATVGQEMRFHSVGEVAQQELTRCLGSNIPSTAVTLTSVTAA